MSSYSPCCGLSDATRPPAGETLVDRGGGRGAVCTRDQLAVATRSASRHALSAKSPFVAVALADHRDRGWRRDDRRDGPGHRTRRDERNAERPARENTRRESP